jgi:hypothetical protein
MSSLIIVNPNMYSLFAFLPISLNTTILNERGHLPTLLLVTYSKQVAHVTFDKLTAWDAGKKH